MSLRAALRSCVHQACAIVCARQIPRAISPGHGEFSGVIVRSRPSMDSFTLVVPAYRLHSDVVIKIGHRDRSSAQPCRLEPSEALGSSGGSSAATRNVVCGARGSPLSRIACYILAGASTDGLRRRMTAGERTGVNPARTRVAHLGYVAMCAECVSLISNTTHSDRAGVAARVAVDAALVDGGPNGSSADRQVSAVVRADGTADGRHAVGGC